MSDTTNTSYTLEDTEYMFSAFIDDLKLRRLKKATGFSKNCDLTNSLILTEMGTYTHKYFSDKKLYALDPASPNGLSNFVLPFAPAEGYIAGTNSNLVAMRAAIQTCIAIHNEAWFELSEGKKLSTIKAFKFHNPWDAFIRRGEYSLIVDGNFVIPENASLRSWDGEVWADYEYFSIPVSLWTAWISYSINTTTWTAQQWDHAYLFTNGYTFKQQLDIEVGQKPVGYYEAMDIRNATGTHPHQARSEFRSEDLLKLGESASGIKN